VIQAYRLVKRKWASHAFDGQGAKRYGGRWNSKGRSCVYLTGSVALGLLEVMVHINDYTILQQYTVFELQFEFSDLYRLSERFLPADWQSYPAPLSTADIGDQWLDKNESAVLAVPSVIVPHEYNYLLNPVHADFDGIIGNAKEIAFRADPRLARRDA